MLVGRMFFVVRIFFCLCSSGIFLCAQEPPVPKAFTLSIAAIFKDEAPYFKEWIEYHRLVGVDHFYLYNNGSKDAFKEVLAPYLANDVVTVIDWPDQKRECWGETKCAWVNYTQIPAYEHACRVAASGHTQWLALIDVDEFLVPVSSQKITDVLAQYSVMPGVMVTWHTFGTSGVQTLAPNTLLIESLHMTCSAEHPLQQKVVKSIVKPELYESFCWPPHACIYRGGGGGIQLPKTEVQLNHYINRTVDYFTTSKVAKKEKMDNRKIPEDELQEWSKVGNDVEDTDKVIHRYVPELRRRMGFDS